MSAAPLRSRRGAQSRASATDEAGPPMSRVCVVRELGRIRYGEALALQKQLAAERKQGLVPDHLLLLEHPHVITMGRNGRDENVLAGLEVLERAGIEFFPTDRGGDV